MEGEKMFTWKEEYSVHIPEIDAQHKELLKIGRELYDMFVLKQETDNFYAIMQVLSKLSEYTSYHFKYEEDLLMKSDYPAFDQHVLEHTYFVNKLLAVLHQDIDNRQILVTGDLLDFISNWITEHILGSDHKYKAYFIEKDIL